MKLYAKTSPDATGHHWPSDNVLAIALNIAFKCLSDLRAPNRKHKMPPATCWRIQLEGWIAGIDWASWEQGEIFKQTNQPPQAFNPNREEKKSWERQNIFLYQQYLTAINMTVPCENFTHLFNWKTIFNSFYYFSVTMLKNKSTVQIQLGVPNTSVSQDTVYTAIWQHSQ